MGEALHQKVVVSEKRHMFVLEHYGLGSKDLPCFFLDAPVDNSIRTFP
jgi:hypothetical protein